MTPTAPEHTTLAAPLTSQPNPAGSTTAADDNNRQFSLDSTYFVAFEMAHQAFKRGLSAASPLNITQYRLLSKLCQATSPVDQSLLGDVLGLRANTVSQTVDVLEQAGFLTRLPGSVDARTRVLEATDAGRAHMATVNDALVTQLYSCFPTSDEHYRTILEAAIYAGSRIERNLDDQSPALRPASRALVAVELVRQKTEQVLKETCGASLSECRIVQKLAEAGQPMRLGAVAEALLMSTINTTRAVDKLVERGWCQRLKSPQDRKAVYVGLTNEGIFQADLIGATVNDLAETHLWANLQPAQKRAIEQMGHIVIAGIQAQREAEQQEFLNTLNPE